MTLDRTPPLVKASTAPLKKSPDDPGGRAIADLGGVGDLLSEQPRESEERLLPRPEQPVTPANVGSTPSNGTTTSSELDPEARSEARAALEALVSEIRSDRSDDDEVGTGGPNQNDSVSFPSPSKPSDSLDDEQQAQTAVADVSPGFQAAADGRYRVQLAAVREEADAKRAWSVFQEKLGPFVTGLQPFFERAETSNGIFYRVQVGPFNETAEADRLCIELKKQNTSCFVVTR